jgi:hypothetical protein
MKIRNLAVFLLGFLTITCTQDPIFFIIAKETAPTKPRIEGAPTNMVVFEREYNDPNNPPEKILFPIMYVASGRLHWYAKAGKGTGESGWDSYEYSIQQPPGKVISLVATKSRLYALCFDDQNANTTLRYIKFNEDGWHSIPGFANYPIQSIYADNEHLFAGARKSDSNSFAILYLDDNDKLQAFKNDADEIIPTSLLSGAVYREQDKCFYLCTRGEFFQVNEDDFAYSQLSSGIVFMGMIKLQDSDETIIAVSRNGGVLFDVIIGDDNMPTLRRMQYTGGNSGDISTGNYATGALALWEGPADSHPNPSLKMLIAGVQGHLYTTSSSSSYSHGYVEFEINGDNSFNTGIFRRDTGRLGSVDDPDRYMASLGKHPINHLFQAPDTIDKGRVFFASTQTAGLWSYRYRDNQGWKGLQWNAEE